MFQKEVLSQEVVCITGGASGIGLAIAKQCVELGAKIIIISRNEERLQAASDKLGDKASYEVLDLRSKNLESLVEKLMLAYQPTALVNNAAANFLCPSLNLSFNGYQSIVETVMQGSFMLTQAFGKYWLSQGCPGKVVSISAFYGDGAGPYVAASAMAKAAIESMTKSLAVEWGRHNIRLNAIAPGYVKTEGAWKRLLPPSIDEHQFLSSVPLSRLAEPKEIAQAVVFTMLNHYITGQVLTIDGGVQLASGAGFFSTAPSTLTEQDWEEMRAQAKR